MTRHMARVAFWCVYFSKLTCCSKNSRVEKWLHTDTSPKSVEIAYFPIFWNSEPLQLFDYEVSMGPPFRVGEMSR